MDLLKKQEKDGKISEDEQNRLSKDIQTETDKHIKLIDDALVAKEKEITQV